MTNRAMAEKLAHNDAIDLSKCAREGDFYVLPAGMFQEGVDYCNAKTEAWIWSIGRRLSDDVILASHTGELYQNPLFECLWLR